MILSPGETARAGDKVQLFFVTASGVELPIGNLVVESASGNTLRARVPAGESKPRKGLKAVVSAGSNPPVAVASDTETESLPRLDAADPIPTVAAARTSRCARRSRRRC